MEVHQLDYWGLSSKLGGGDCGSVYQYKHRHKGPFFAVKTTNDNKSHYQRNEETEFCTLLALSTLDIPGLNRAYSFAETRPGTDRVEYVVAAFVDGKAFYIGMHKACGKTFGRLSEIRGCRTLPPDQRQAIALKLLRILHAMEKYGVSHADLNINNLLIDIKETDTLEMTIIDFGPVASDATSSVTGRFWGYINRLFVKTEDAPYAKILFQVCQ